MKTRRSTRRLVRYWVPRFRRADDDAVRVYHRYAGAIYGHTEAWIIERVTRSEARRRVRVERERRIQK